MKEIKVYTTLVCPFCVAAKRLLDQRGYTYAEIDLTNDMELRQKLSEENSGFRTVPMIFVGEMFVGGFQELQSLDAQGKLKELVES